MAWLHASLTALVIASSVVGQARSRDATSTGAPSGWTPQVRTELSTTLIVRGRIVERDPGSLEHAMVVGGSYVRLHVQVRELLKGEFGHSRVPLTFFAAPSGHAHGYVPSANQMRQLIGQERVLYLLRYTDHHFFLADRFGHTAVRMPTPAILDEIRRSTARHEAMAESLPPQNTRLADAIGKLLAYASEGPNEQLRAFIQLDRLGTAAIPTLVHFLEDTETLSTRALLLQDTTQTEMPVLREYRPELVSDAVCTLMHQRTHEHFGLDYSRPLDEQRAREHACWRVYAHYVAADPTFDADLEAERFDGRPIADPTLAIAPEALSTESRDAVVTPIPIR